MKQRSANSTKEAKAAAQLLNSPNRGPRAIAVEMMKERALQGLDALEKYKDECVLEMALREGYPRSTTLSQLQQARVTGASSFYSYYCRLRKFVLQGDIEAIQSATSSSLAMASTRTAAQTTAPELIKRLKSYHTSGRLTSTQYDELERIVKSRKC